MDIQTNNLEGEDKFAANPNQAKEADLLKNVRLLKILLAVQSFICLIWVVMWVASDLAMLKAGEECSLLELFFVFIAAITAFIAMSLSFDMLER